LDASTVVIRATLYTRDMPKIKWGEHENDRDPEPGKLTEKYPKTPSNLPRKSALFPVFSKARKCPESLYLCGFYGIILKVISI